MMATLGSSYCARCLYLDGNARVRTCKACRDTDKHEAERLARIDARKAREQLYADRLDGTWSPVSGRVLAASAAVTLMLAGQAQAAVPVAPDTEPFIGIILLCALALIGLVGMMLPRPWPPRRPAAPDPHATPYGDVPGDRS